MIPKHYPTTTITPSKQSRVLRKSRANDPWDDISAMKRRLTADFENQAVKRYNCAADADESIENPNSLEDRTREIGRLFACARCSLLYSEWNGNKNISHLFRNDLLLKIYASLIRGPSGAVGLFDGQSKRPADNYREDAPHPLRPTLCNHQLGHPGPHLLPTSHFSRHLFQAIWLHSADTILTEIGDQTSINYRARHSYYLQHIVEALASNKAWAVGLLVYWDRTLFPDADSPNNVDGSAGREIEEDDEDLFASVQALTRPRSTRIHSSTSPPPRRLTPSPPSPQRTPAASSSRQEQENCESTSHGGHSCSPRCLQRHGEGQRRC
ncbi:hypothetical protein DFH08DRAFT_804748 [Mycena albidolilacea]|uniref:Uncharacterized protein n=1 Tax=Mycena albidolilacea TaxID=1033008 RepID=A0AAD7AA49_9AGAR|nr:hypothetical protein DFH08DRAFT_804748 [Mycena albidolilacea]